MLLALTRPVPASIIHCELTRLAREPIDWARAVTQHEQYEEALRAAGCQVRRLEGDDAYPDSVFIEDTAVVFDECAVITRPGAASRRGETTAVAAALRELRTVTCIEEPGTLDGGDVLLAGRRVMVGLSSRTNLDGVRQLARMLEPLGYTVGAVEVRDVLHLKSAVTAIDDELLLLNPRMIDADALGSPAPAHLEVDPAEPMAANVLPVGGVVLCPAGAPRTRARIERAGYDVVPVDASELAKAEGALTCCSLIVRRP